MASIFNGNMVDKILELPVVIQNVSAIVYQGRLSICTECFFFCILLFFLLHLHNLYISLMYAYCVCVCLGVLVILRRVLTSCVGCSGWWSHEGLRASGR